MRPLIVLLMLSAIAGCSSPDEKAQHEEEKANAECAKAGYLMDSPGFEECKLEVKERDDQRLQDRINAGNSAGQFQSDRSGTGGAVPSGYSMPLR